MYIKGSFLGLILFLNGLFSLAQAQDKDKVLSIDTFIPYVSTVPANKDQIVGLHLRERVLESTQKNTAKGTKPEVVLFVHGGFSPSTVAYDLNHKDFSWMANLAKDGFDTFALTMTAYGSSPRPYMDDPCNVDPKQQSILIPHILKAPCTPHYPYKLVSSQTEWDEVEAAVRYIRKIRGVDKINLTIDDGKQYLIPKNVLMLQGQFLNFKSSGFELQKFLPVDVIRNYSIKD